MESSSEESYGRKPPAPPVNSDMSGGSSSISSCPMSPLTGNTAGKSFSDPVRGKNMMISPMLRSRLADRLSMTGGTLEQADLPMSDVLASMSVRDLDRDSISLRQRQRARAGSHASPLVSDSSRPLVAIKEEPVITFRPKSRRETAAALRASMNALRGNINKVVCPERPETEEKTQNSL